MTRLHDVPEHLPIDNLPTQIPLDWSAEQALAAIEWLAQLRERVWLLYADDIQELLREANPGRLLSGGDDLPF
jgi:hypothetical protein